MQVTSQIFLELFKLRPTLADRKEHHRIITDTRPLIHWKWQTNSCRAWHVLVSIFRSGRQGMQSWKATDDGTQRFLSPSILSALWGSDGTLGWCCCPFGRHKKRTLPKHTCFRALSSLPFFLILQSLTILWVASWFRVSTTKPTNDGVKRARYKEWETNEVGFNKKH